MRFVLILGVIVVVGVLAAGSLAAALILRDTSRPSEATAQYIPADANLYAYVDLEAVQGEEAKQLLSPFQGELFDSFHKEFLAGLAEELGFDPLEELALAGATSLSVAAFDVDQENPQWTLLVQVDDRDAALSFMRKAAEANKTTRSGDPSWEVYKGADLVVGGEEDILALTDNYLLSGGSRAQVTDAIDSLDSPPSNPLSEDAAFINAAEALPSDREAFLFLRSETIELGLQGGLDPSDGLGIGVPQLGEVAPELMAISASLIERGVRLDLYMDPVEGVPVPTAENRLLSADRLPGDALMLFSFVGANEAWQQFRDSGGADDLFGQTNRAGEAEGLAAIIGLGALDSVMETLTGEVALALLPSDVQISSDGDFESGTIDALLMAETADAGGFEALLDIVMGMITPGLSMMDPEGAQSFQPSQIDIGEYQAKFWDLSGLLGGSFNYEPGYLVTEDMLVIGSTTDSLADFNGALTGEISSLRSNETFSRALDLAPEPLQFLMYADIAGIVEMVENAMAPETLVEYTQQVKPIVAPFESFIVAGSSTEEAIRFTLAVTIKE